MSITLNPYLSFRSEAREAMTFYQSVFGGNLTLNTYAEFHASEDPSEQDKIMHAQLTTDDGLTLMAADTPNAMAYDAGSAISVSLSGDDKKLRTFFEALAAGGKVLMPLEKQMWGDTFGMCTDKFGIDWMVNLAA